METTSEFGWIHFVTNREVDELGGMDRLVKNPLSRNLWHIMKEFKVLPTDERFVNLSDEQIGFILGNMVYDNKLEEQARKGINPDSYFEDEEDGYWTQDINEFVALKEDHDEEDIAKQVETLTNKEELAKVRERFNSTEEWNDFMEKGGALAERVEKEKYLQEKLDKLFEEAEELNNAGVSRWGEPKFKEQTEAVAKLKPLKEDDLQDAISLFNGETDEAFSMPTVLDDDDDYTI